MAWATLPFATARCLMESCGALRERALAVMLNSAVLTIGDATSADRQCWCEDLVQHISINPA
eukprot:2644214-Pleurochrysis_carterae.AAC.4